MTIEEYQEDFQDVSQCVIVKVRGNDIQNNNVDKIV